MASRSVSFQRPPVVSSKRVARRRVHASQLSEEFGRFPRRAMVQDQESGGRVHPSIRPIVDRRERLLFRAIARPEILDRTEQRGASASAQPEPCRPREPGRPSRPGVPAPPGTARRPACPTSKSANASGPSRSVPSLTKVANAPNALAVAAPLSTMDAKVRTASAATGESVERDKP